MMLDVVRGFYKEYNGEWNEGVSYVYSPLYNVNKPHEFNSKSLEKIIKDFFKFGHLLAQMLVLLQISLLGNKQN